MTHPDDALRVAALISGTGSNMLAIARRCASGEIPAQVVLVASDRADAPGLAAATALGIETLALPPRPGEARSAYDARLREAIDARRPGLVVLAGFMRILDTSFVDAYAGRLLNIHPSLLPRHKGLHTHQRAIDAGDRTHGATVHYVTPELDGGPAVLQARLHIHPGEDARALSARVQACEHVIYPRVVDWVARRRLGCPGGQPELDGHPLVQPIVEDFDAPPR